MCYHLSLVWCQVRILRRSPVWLQVICLRQVPVVNGRNGREISVGDCPWLSEAFVQKAETVKEMGLYRHDVSRTGDHCIIRWYGTDVFSIKRAWLDDSMHRSVDDLQRGFLVNNYDSRHRKPIHWIPGSATNRMVEKLSFDQLWKILFYLYLSLFDALAFDRLIGCPREGTFRCAWIRLRWRPVRR